MNGWHDVTHNEPKQGLLVDVKIRHCNDQLKLKDRIVTGYMGEDNFYLKEGSELSFNWDILCWKKHEN